MSKRRATSSQRDSEQMEEVMKLEKRESGGETTKEYVLFSGDAVFVTEMNVVCLSGPVTGEERIMVTVTMRYKMRDMHYMIGKTVKLGFLMKDYCDRNGFTKSKSEFEFNAPRISRLIAQNQTPEELGMRDGDVIVADLILRGG